MEIILAVAPILGIVATILGIITALLFLLEKCRKAEKISKTTIKFNLSPELKSESITFGLLHIRNGKDQIPDHGPLLNQKVAPYLEGNRLAFKIKHIQRLGFQFKCFADYRGVEFAEIKSELEKAGFSFVSQGAGKAGRAWFILPKYEICTTIDGFTNNFFLPE